MFSHCGNRSAMNSNESSSVPSIFSITNIPVVDQEIFNPFIPHPTYVLDFAMRNDEPCRYGWPSSSFLPSASIPDHEDDWNLWNEYGISNPEIPLEYSQSTMESPVSILQCPTMSPTPEQGEDVVVEALSVMESAAAHAKSAGIFGSTSTAGSSMNESTSAGCSRMCTGCVWLASACPDAHRLTASEIGRNTFFKGVTKKETSDKWTCEIRISTKLRKDSKLEANVRKVWLGTFDTPCQAARALQVGRFLLSEKTKTKNPTNFEQVSKTKLSTFKDFMRKQSLNDDLLKSVKKLAKDYGKKGSL